MKVHTTHVHSLPSTLEGTSQITPQIFRVLLDPHNNVPLSAAQLRFHLNTLNHMQLLLLQLLLVGLLQLLLLLDWSLLRLLLLQQLRQV